MNKKGEELSVTDLVKTDKVYLSTYIDSLWADTEDPDAFEASLRIHNPSCHGGWQRWWHCDGDDIQRLNNDGFYWHLHGKRAKPSSVSIDYLFDQIKVLHLLAWSQANE